MSSPAPFRGAVSGLAEVSTVHGLRYVLNFGARSLDRLLWTLICLSAVGIGLFMSAQLWITWHFNPVTTTIGTAALPIAQMEFPAITLCSPGNDIQSVDKMPPIFGPHWDTFWNHSSYDQAFETMDSVAQNRVILDFMMDSVPGWPAELSLEEFVLHMTTDDHHALINVLILAKHQALEDKPKFDIFLDPNRTNERDERISDMENEVTQLFSKMNLSPLKTQEIVLAALWFTSLPCDRLIQACKWKSQEIPCGSVFRLIPTDIGFCCAFNHDSMIHLLRNSHYANILDDIEERYQSHFRQSNPQKRDITLDQIKFIPQAGRHNGLEVAVDINSFDITSTSVQQDFLGIYGSVSPKNQFPMLNTNSFLIAPGHVTHVEISGVKMSATKELRDTLTPAERNCYFTDEYPLQLFSDYTMTNCWMESLMNFSKAAIQNEANCCPWNFPSQLEPPCKPIAHHRFLEEFTFFDESQMIGKDNCRPNCGGTEFSTSITSAPFRECDHSNFGLTKFCSLGHGRFKPQKWADKVLRQYTEWYQDKPMPEFIEQIKSSKRYSNPDPIFQKELVERQYDAYSRDIAVINFYFSKPVATELISAPSMTMIQYVSSVGGLLGLFIGFSLISGVEILYWLTIGYAKKILHARQMQSRKEMKAPLPPTYTRKPSHSVTPVY